MAQTTSKLTILHNFQGTPDADDPNCVLENGGVLYGTSYAGGAYDVGALFSLAPDHPASPRQRR
jgi:uncharacterized repeat protein (TIGR03803 family)